MKQTVLFLVVLLLLLQSANGADSNFSLVRDGKLYSVEVTLREDRLEKRDCLLYIIRFIKQGVDDFEEQYYEYVDTDMKPLGFLKIQLENGRKTETVQGMIGDQEIILSHSCGAIRTISRPEKFYFQFLLPEAKKKRLLKEKRETAFFDEANLSFGTVMEKETGMDMAFDGEKVVKAKVFEWEMNSGMYLDQRRVYFDERMSLIRYFSRMTDELMNLPGKAGESVWWGSGSRGVRTTVPAGLWQEGKVTGIVVERETFYGPEDSPECRIPESGNVVIKDLSCDVSGGKPERGGKVDPSASELLTLQVINLARSQSDAGGTPMELIDRVRDYFCTKIDFASWKERPPQEVMESGRGSCAEQTLLFNWILRLSGFQVRDVAGIKLHQGGLFFALWGEIKSPEGWKRMDLFSGPSGSVWFPFWRGEINSQALLKELSAAEKILRKTLVYPLESSGPSVRTDAVQRIGNSVFSSRFGFGFDMGNPFFRINCGQGCEFQIEQLTETGMVLKTEVDSFPRGAFEDLRGLFTCLQDRLKRKNPAYRLNKVDFRLEQPQFLSFSYFSDAADMASERLEGAIFCGNRVIRFSRAAATSRAELEKIMKSFVKLD
ncbi:MAG: transglutaminase-like domain-containing protein [Candidatus Wallbacteria bacterium]|nr:transglutaminase-like domain-containing protein [Candidatus Wallbacteria bacterium]